MSNELTPKELDNRLQQFRDYLTANYGEQTRTRELFNELFPPKKVGLWGVWHDCYTDGLRKLSTAEDWKDACRMRSNLMDEGLNPGGVVFIEEQR